MYRDDETNYEGTDKGRGFINRRYISIQTVMDRPLFHSFFFSFFIHDTSSVNFRSTGTQSISSDIALATGICMVE